METNKRKNQFRVLFAERRFKDAESIKKHSESLKKSWVRRKKEGENNVLKNEKKEEEKRQRKIRKILTNIFEDMEKSKFAKWTSKGWYYEK